MYSMKHVWKLKRSCPMLLFFIVIIIIYRHLTLSPRPVAEPPHTRAPPREEEPPEPPPPEVWLLAFTDVDVCIHLATLFPHWTVLLVGNVRSPEQPALRHSRCLYFKDEQVPGLTQETGLLEDYLAYLYAIKNGAEAIYIKPVDAETIAHRHDLLDWRPGPSEGLVVSSRQTFNPMCHWGCNASWSVPCRENQYKLCGNMLVTMQVHAHQVVEENAVNGAYQHSMDSEKFCDAASPSVVISSETVVYFQKEGAFITRESFWALAFISEEFTDENYILVLLMQKIMSIIGQNLMVHLGRDIKTVSLGNSGSQETSQKIQSLRCKSEEVIPCIREIIQKSESLGLIHTETETNVKAWLNALEAVRYHVDIWTYTDKNSNCAPNAVQYRPINHNVPYTVMGWKTTPFPPITNIATIHKTHQEICPNSPESTNIKVNFEAPWVQWEDILLIIVFNNPLYNVIPFTETLYRPFFPHILYCGPEKLQESNFGRIKDFNISFIAYDPTPQGHFPGAFSYKCLTMAVRMKFNVLGYLTIADDLVLVPDKLRKLNTDKAWYLPKNEIKTADIVALRECRLGTCDFHTHWRWWEDYQSASKKAIHELKSAARKSRLMRQCLGTMETINGGEFRINGGYSDIYYLPKNWAVQFTEIADIFLRNYVFLELAVPTLIKCLVPEGEIAPLLGKQIWDESRDESWLYFTKKDLLYKSYLHPAKWSFIEQGSDLYRQYFCNVILYIHDRYGRVNKVETL